MYYYYYYLLVHYRKKLINAFAAGQFLFAFAFAFAGRVCLIVDERGS